MIKRLTANKIFLWVFALLLTFPMLNIAFRCGYVMLNKNAYESYYGETINESIDINLSIDELKTNQEYKLIANAPIGDTTQYRFSINISGDIVWNGTTLNNIVAFNFYVGGSGGGEIPYLYTVDNTNTYSNYINLNTSSANIVFTYVNHVITTEGTNVIQDSFYQTTYNKYSYLDNAFDYSVNQFLEDNGNGVIQFTSLFDDIFFATQNDHTANILNYINWYMNYALFLSCSYFVFEILIFFINYARKWLYRFTEDGGK